MIAVRQTNKGIMDCLVFVHSKQRCHSKIININVVYNNNNSNWNYLLAGFL